MPAGKFETKKNNHKNIGFYLHHHIYCCCNTERKIIDFNDIFRLDDLFEKKYIFFKVSFSNLFTLSIIVILYKKKFFIQP